MASRTILVTGVSGTGKSTVCRELAKKGVNTIGIDETEHLSFWVRKDNGEVFVGDDVEFDSNFLDAHNWVCDIKVLQSLIDKVDGSVVVCGNVENVVEVMKQCDLTLLLECSPETFLARVDSREDNDYGQNEDSKNLLLGYYEDDNRKILDAGAKIIDAEQPVDEVIADVMKHIHE